MLINLMQRFRDQPDASWVQGELHQGFQLEFGIVRVELKVKVADKLDQCQTHFHH